MTVITPKLTLERKLLGECGVIIALDEVGRGALAGPVAVGAAMMDAAGVRRRVPDGLRDSKLVTEKRRPDVAARAAAWVQASAVGWASAEEVDQVGIMRALGLAASRAVSAIAAQGASMDEALVLLDGEPRLRLPSAYRRRCACDPSSSRPRLRLRVCGLRDREGGPRPVHGRTSREPSCVSVESQQGLREPRTP